MEIDKKVKIGISFRSDISEISIFNLSGLKKRIKKGRISRIG